MATNTTVPTGARLGIGAHTHGSPVTIGSFPSPVVTIPLGERQVGGQPAVSAGGLWEGSSLQAATRLSVPIALGALVVVFVVVQWLIDRRDPKFVEAPARKDDDSIGFD